MKIFAVAVLFVFFNFTTLSQTYQFKVLSTENTNIYPYIYSINQDSIGYLWLGTGDGLYLYDGNVLNSFPLTFIGGDNFITSIAIDKKGMPYIGLNNGTVVSRQGNEFILLKETIRFKSTISQISYSDNDLFVAVQNKGIYRINHQYQVYDSIIIPNVQTYCFIKFKSHIIIGTSEGIYIYQNNQLNFLDHISKSKVECFLYNQHSKTLFVGTEEEGMLELTLKNNQLQIFKSYSFIDNIKDIVADSDGNIYVATMGSGVFFYRRNPLNNTFSLEFQFNNQNGLPNLQIKDLFIDKENNLWIGSYGGGLFQYYESAFNILFTKIDGKDVSHTAVYALNEFIFSGTADGKILKINVKNPQVYSSIIIPEIKNHKITALYLDNYFILWIGTETKGVFLYDVIKNKLIKHINFRDNLQNNISAIDGYGNYRCIGTKNGLIVLNTEKQPYEYETYTTVQGLSHNYINHLLCDLKGELWIATPTNFISKYNFNTKKITLEKINSGDILKVTSLCLDVNNQLWLATYGNGIFKYDTILTNYTSSNGLFSDYSYSIIFDETGTIWLGHRQGITSIKGNTIRTFSKNIGLYSDCNPNAVNIDKYGSIWFGTTKGLVRYNYKKSVINKVPPTVLVTSIKINDVEQLVEPYIELEAGRYKLQISFTGISLRESEGVTFQYILEGYDVSWSEITNNRTVLYPRLEEGTYTFKVIAYNYDKVASLKPYTVKIKILPPFYKRWWFILVSALFVIYMFYIILKIRERNHKRMEKILKEKLDQRTKEVVKQKELIERKNKDITDSIQYAKRIQEAIFPSLKTLQEYYPQSFVFYLPRDIVSGDFYMFSPIEKSFIIICADATGHGVPGAFMSLISSTILKDILHKYKSIKPSQLLYQLDAEISQIFNQENSETQDGLDLSVCLFDQTTNILTFSAAMRPLLIFKNNKWTYYKGSRYSIGFSKYNIQKEFTDNYIKLDKGDRFYLFTDGLPDQFSNDNKKLKISGLIHWLEEIQNLSLIEQQKELHKKLILWKGEQHQIDDILLIGVEV